MMTKASKILVGVAFLCCFSLVATAQLSKNSINKQVNPVVSNAIYVDKNSTLMVEKGTSSRPYQSLAKAIEKAPENSVLHLAPGTYTDIKVIDKPGLIITGENVTIGGNEPQEEYELFQNFPNPFSLSTEIKYILPKSTMVTIKVLDMSGNEIRTILEEEQSAGENSVTWDGKDNLGRIVGDDTYIYQIIADDFKESQRMYLRR